jgi:Putative prokaryotic signal transducing protein
MTEYCELMRTGKPHETDMAANALTENGIPFIRRQHTGSLTTSMPLTPSPGLGVSWSIAVPHVALDDARRILTHLPMEVNHTPSQFDFNPQQGKRNLARFYAAIFGMIVGFVLLAKLIEIIWKPTQ